MAKKYYAVKKGKKTGIFETWNECKRCVDGFSGAEYKSFKNKKDAEDYLNEDGQAITSNEDKTIDGAVAYVDGSFNSETKEFTYGAVIFWNDKEYHFSDRFDDEELAKMHNVAGELKGSEKAIEFALEKSIGNLTIYHDYEGIAKWCTGEWKAKKTGTQAYKAFYDSVKGQVEINFVKVKAHSGDKYNELADTLAKEAFNKPISLQTQNINLNSRDKEPEIELVKRTNVPVYIDRDEIDDIIFSIGSKEWIEFKCEKLTKVGNAERCVFYIDGKKAVLDFHFRKNGPTTIKPTSSNMELSEHLKALIEEQCAYKDNGVDKTHSLAISKDWSTKLIDYIKSLDKVKYDCITQDNPKHDRYNFQSNIGDRITLSIYYTGKLVIQGKPAYLYSEVISFLSYCPEITIDDIVEVNNKLQEIDIKVGDIRQEISNLMPKAYGNIDDTIIKMLSPSFTFKKIKLDLEDYSCYAFPALRALEGYLKYLFDLKGIVVDYKIGKFYDYNQSNGQYYLKGSYSTTISDSKMQLAMENIYNYFHSNRHTLFHTEQILIASRILEDKQEADTIINEVINMIESTYNDITK